MQILKINTPTVRIVAVKVIVDENAGFGTRFATVSYAAGSNSGSVASADSRSPSC